MARSRSPSGRVAGRRGQQTFDVVAREEVRQVAALARAVQSGGRIGGELALAAQETAPGTHGSQPPRDRASRA